MTTSFHVLYNFFYNFLNTDKTTIFQDYTYIVLADSM